MGRSRSTNRDGVADIIDTIVRKVEPKGNLHMTASQSGNEIVIGGPECSIFVIRALVDDYKVSRLLIAEDIEMIRCEDNNTRVHGPWM